MGRRDRRTSLPPPFLKRVWLPSDIGSMSKRHPFNLPFIATGGFDIGFTNAVTIIVGENGSGKTTVLKTIATMAGFSAHGGGPGMRAVDDPYSADDAGLGALLKASWLPQVRRGWFFSAETFFSVARYLDEVGSPRADYLGASHGEGFLDFFEERLRAQGLYILDEPEAALSPSRQFELLRILRRIQRAGDSQLILATHSPILMALPGAELLQLERTGLRPTRFDQTAHFKLYRDFILYPEETIEAMIGKADDAI